MLDIPLILFGGLEGVLCHEQIGPPRPWRPEDHVFGIGIANCFPQVCTGEILRPSSRCDHIRANVL